MFKTNKNIIYLAGFAIVLIAFISLELYGFVSVGKLINSFYPCVENPADSTYCYVEYDFVAGIAALLLLGGCVTAICILLVSRTLKSKQ